MLSVPTQNHIKQYLTGKGNMELIILWFVNPPPWASRMHVPLGVTGKGHVHICTVNPCNRWGIPIFVFPTPLSTIMILDWSVGLTGKRDMHASILCSNFLQRKSDLKYDSWDPSLDVSCLLIYPFLHLSSLPRFCIKLPLTISSKVERKKESFNSIHETNQLKLLASYKQHLTLPWNWCSYRVSRLITTFCYTFTRFSGERRIIMIRPPVGYVLS